MTGAVSFRRRGPAGNDSRPLYTVSSPRHSAQFHIPPYPTLDRRAPF